MSGRRRLLVLAVFACLVPGAALVLSSVRPTRRINRESYERLRAGGMSFEEVVKLLGGPPGDYRTGEVDLDTHRSTGQFMDVMLDPDVLLGKRHLRHEWWQGDEGTLWVCFDEDQGERTLTAEFTPGVARPIGLLTRLLRWLGR